MKFQRYPDIENSYREKMIDQIRVHAPKGVYWVATEKIHGCNFSIISDGASYGLGSRNNIVDGTFFNCGELVDEIKDNIMAMASHVMEVYESTAPTFVTVFGELYGPGIQASVQYSKEKEFAVFDIVVHTEEGRQFYLDFDKIVWLSEKFGFDVVPIIGTGLTLEQALNVSPIMQSLASDYSVEAEGVVIKPNETQFLPSGKRMILKNKHPKFAENKNNKPKKPPEPLSAELQSIYDIVIEYCNEARFEAVFSKQQWERKEMGPFIGAFFGDMMKDAMEDHPTLFEGTEKADVRRLNKLMNSSIAATVRDLFLERT